MNVSWEDHGWERLADTVGRRRLPGWDATCGLIVGSEGALLYDTGSTLREGAELRVQAEALLRGRRVTHIALGHPHFDHVMGTAAFAGARVYGAMGVDALLRRERDALRLDAVRHGVAADEAAEAADALVVPEHLVSGELTVDLGGGCRVLLANAGPGHTGHDLAAFVPGRPEAAGAPGVSGAPGMPGVSKAPGAPRVPGAPGVVFCGDLVEESGEPQAGPDAAGSRWPAALDRLLALGGEDAVYVPGHGAVVGAAFVRAQRDALAERFAVS
ncbi:MBL fold hydrolase [Streptomyces inusitatus]|uniref:MBL fold hydrolase n=1 Tax=Streptomyces inusitatus TaxID=68221 RepID=A0A918PZZ5_9ACTN|nr:MBL fold metallo-hydrolase [Streptomyces inusitatus]GGZ27648.1 MBL fold hydrolase [Streptomyces inusitatus]